MLGRDRDAARRARGRRPRARRRAAAALGLVGDEDDGLAGAAQPVGEMAIERRHAGARIDEEERDVGVGERALGLRPHARGELARRRLLEPGGIDDAEAQIAEARLGLAAVARHAGRVVHQRQALAGEAVEQRRFADIGPAEDGHRQRHARAASAQRDEVGLVGQDVERLVGHRRRDVDAVRRTPSARAARRYRARSRAPRRSRRPR